MNGKCAIAEAPCASQGENTNGFSQKGKSTILNFSIANCISLSISCPPIYPIICLRNNLIILFSHNITGGTFVFKNEIYTIIHKIKNTTMSSLSKRIYNITEDHVRWIIMDFQGSFMPFSLETYKAGWRRFRFTNYKKKDTRLVNLVVPGGVTFITDDYNVCNTLTVLYPHINFKFEKQNGHKQLEKLCGKPWDRLIKSKKVHINGATAVNSGIESYGKSPLNWALPSEIGQLTQLKEFGITESTCVKIPKSIRNLKSLREIWFVDNDYGVELGDFVGNMKRLEKISWETDCDVSDSITKCKFLREFYLQCCESTEIPDLSSLFSLEVLYIQNARFYANTLPDWICGCTNLRELVIKDSQLEKLSKQLIFMELDFLDISCNNIEKFPEWFYMVNSAHIDVSGNELEEIPESFMRLGDSVKTLTIHTNPLRIVPRDIHRLCRNVQIVIRSHDSYDRMCLCEQDRNIIENIYGF